MAEIRRLIPLARAQIGPGNPNPGDLINPNPAVRAAQREVAELQAEHTQLERENAREKKDQQKVLPFGQRKGREGQLAMGEGLPLGQLAGRNRKRDAIKRAAEAANQVVEPVAKQQLEALDDAIVQAKAHARLLGPTHDADQKVVKDLEKERAEFVKDTKDKKKGGGFASQSFGFEEFAKHIQDSISGGDDPAEKTATATEKMAVLLKKLGDNGFKIKGEVIGIAEE
jgi:hypothetical protein